jgi:hypothetical protein
MNLRRLITRLLAALVIAGLAIAPLATPSAAKAMDRADMTGVEAMAADMPCCPDQQKSKDCQDCPLVAMCVLKTTQAGPSPTQALPLRHPIRAVHSLIDDVPAEGLDRPPPDHPPRNLV